MRVKSLMISNPITISENATIQDAIEIMKQNSIRHLPVVTKQKILKGFVTLADLKQALLPSMLSGLTLKDFIIKNPITVDPDDDIETAARLIYEHKISGMPVVKNNQLKGIITDSDILRTFIDMLGLLSSSSRIDVALGDDINDLNRVIQIILDMGVNIIHIGMTTHPTSHRTYYFRLSPCDTDTIKKALEKEGVRVVDEID